MKSQRTATIAGLLSLPNRRWKKPDIFYLKIVASLAVRLAKKLLALLACSLANTSWALLLLLPPIPASPAFHQDRDRLRLFPTVQQHQTSLTFGLTRLQAF